MHEFILRKNTHNVCEILYLFCFYVSISIVGLIIIVLV